MLFMQSSGPDIVGSPDHSFRNFSLRNEVVLRLEYITASESKVRSSLCCMQPFKSIRQPSMLINVIIRIYKSR